MFFVTLSGRKPRVRDLREAVQQHSKDPTLPVVLFYKTDGHVLRDEHRVRRRKVWAAWGDDTQAALTCLEQESPDFARKVAFLESLCLTPLDGHQVVHMMHAVFERCGPGRCDEIMNALADGYEWDYEEPLMELVHFFPDVFLDGNGNFKEDLVLWNQVPNRAA